MAKTIQAGPGDCVSSIAFAHGFFPDTVWNHANNAALKALREEYNVLEEGDQVFVPDLRQHQVAAAVGQRHRFRRRGVPERLKLRLTSADAKPRAGLSYTLRIKPGIEEQGVTDGDGWIKAFIPPDATEGTLELPDGESYQLSLGHLRPADSVRGMRQRLHNLGYACGQDEEGMVGPGTRQAVVDFMSDDTGKDCEWAESLLTEAQQKLRERHGS